MAFIFLTGHVTSLWLMAAQMRDNKRRQQTVYSLDTYIYSWTSIILNTAILQPWKANCLNLYLLPRKAVASQPIDEGGQSPGAPRC